ncbi:MAG: hypothetical protein HOC91_17885 [Nitrospinaceae bacterium]|jgi:hypothetical protein|nr:hypothetical protein [Nitrospinaceae bacterium]MBT3434944.1 hypothetical protein [Nitrospinaceae bacterium]MBT3822540.1 hypothetical protein [Nitrospinaceae bacterium]MBT4094304.1 hypothetical protein [Nitrospinaceae bacterium]MBT4432384.1 hypothetical protein [Nitrospinaceae bacterium]
MSHYDILQVEGSKLSSQLIRARGIPAFFTAVLAVFVANAPLISLLSFFIGGVVFFGSSQLFHYFWKLTSHTYRQWVERSNQIATEIARLRKRIGDIFDRYPARKKGEQFKKSYDLAGKSLSDLEETLAVGMHREGREVFVTAFMRKGIAVRVTASIGSLNRCSAADNPVRWKDHVYRLKCDEIRQYHNHPEYNGKTQPSTLDFKSAILIKPLLGQHATKLRSLIIYWNKIREWKILEYDGKGQYWNQSEFDAAVQQQVSTDHR